MAIERKIAVIRNFGVASPTFDLRTNAVKNLFSRKHLGCHEEFGSFNKSLTSAMLFKEVQSAAELSDREVKRMDRFSMLALAACRRAVDSENLTEKSKKNCGLILGNMVAGWTFTEPQLDLLHEKGPLSVSPYLASAWFPAAAQGQVTIKLGLKGFAKTITTDRAAGSQAVGLTVNRILHDQGTKYLAGGVDAPVTPFVKAAFEQARINTENIVEGAAFLLITACSTARSINEIKIKNNSAVPLDYRDGFPARQLENYILKIADGLKDSLRPDAVVCNVAINEEVEKSVGEIIAGSFHCRPSSILYSSRLLGDSLAASGPMAFGIAYSLLKKWPHLYRSILILSIGHQCAHSMLIYR